ncbi:hypothetical protein CHS0354_034020 [Potamilus streckersoni]|uniref:Uncharacterized protein n=1 Tax=Potamilus streckersoni TaxID=2493646 RepID=A0AAE0RNB3_9BIVA|nr:hypothetical protein CHS0354_034020 [Potamilus streckersoni]
MGGSVVVFVENVIEDVRVLIVVAIVVPIVGTEYVVLDILVFGFEDESTVTLVEADVDEVSTCVLVALKVFSMLVGIVDEKEDAILAVLIEVTVFVETVIDCNDVVLSLLNMTVEELLVLCGTVDDVVVDSVSLFPLINVSGDALDSAIVELSWVIEGELIKFWLVIIVAVTDSPKPSSGIKHKPRCSLDHSHITQIYRGAPRGQVV